MDTDMLWRVEPLPAHPNGLRFAVFDEEGDLIAANEYFSLGGGFIANERTQVDENLFYRAIDKGSAGPARRQQNQPSIDALPSPSDDGYKDEAATQKTTEPPHRFRNARELVQLSKRHNLTIAQIVWENELSYMSAQEVSDGLLRIWHVMDGCIRDGVSSSEERLPGRLRVRRRASGLYKRLFKGALISRRGPCGAHARDVAGFYPSVSFPSKQATLEGSTDTTLEVSARGSAQLTSLKGQGRSGGARMVVGQLDHDLPVVPWKSTVLPGIDFLSCYAIAVNEVNAAGGRVVTAPTNGASGVIPSVLKWTLEFVSDDPDRDVKNFLLTAGAVGMLFKRGSTISAAEGGCVQPCSLSLTVG